MLTHWDQMQDEEARRFEEEQWGDMPKTAYDKVYGRAPAVDRRMERKMGLIAKDSGGGGDFKRVPPGTHVARCFRVVDLGTQEIDWKGQRKEQRKIMISWEVFGEDDEGNDLVTEDGMPLVVSNRYTLSLSEKANLRAHLQSWRGKPFTPVELEGFDITNLLGAFCMLNIIHNGEGDKVYANVAGITPVPKQLKATLPRGVHETQFFDVMNPDMAMFEKFYDKLKQTIQQSAEWRSHQNGPRKASDPVTTDADDDDSDIPF